MAFDAIRAMHSSAPPPPPWKFLRLLRVSPSHRLSINMFQMIFRLHSYPLTPLVPFDLTYPLPQTYCAVVERRSQGASCRCVIWPFAVGENIIEFDFVCHSFPLSPRVIKLWVLELYQTHKMRICEPWLLSGKLKGVVKNQKIRSFRVFFSQKTRNFLLLTVKIGQGSGHTYP